MPTPTVVFLEITLHYLHFTPLPSFANRNVSRARHSSAREKSLPFHLNRLLASRPTSLSPHWLWLTASSFVVCCQPSSMMTHLGRAPPLWRADSPSSMPANGRHADRKTKPFFFQNMEAIIIPDVRLETGTAESKKGLSGRRRFSPDPICAANSFGLTVEQGALVFLVELSFAFGAQKNTDSTHKHTPAFTIFGAHDENQRQMTQTESKRRKNQETLNCLVSPCVTPGETHVHHKGIHRPIR